MSTLRSQREERIRDAWIYPVITPQFCGGRPPEEVAAALVGAGARLLQLRVKEGPDLERFRLAERFRRITADGGCLLMINDRPDVALAVDADGVHLGQDDLPVSVVRALMPDALVGLSTHNPAEIAAALAQDVSLINIGPIYATATKVNPMAPLGTESLKEYMSRVPIPFSVMGGIKEHHIPELRSMGVRLIAMVTELTQSPDPGATFTRLRSLLAP